MEPACWIEAFASLPSSRNARGQSRVGGAVFLPFFFPEHPERPRRNYGSRQVRASELTAFP